MSDPYLPISVKPSLQQYDNYQIHDLYCEDILYQDAIVNGTTIAAPPPVKFRNFLAVENMSPTGFIECNFNLIATLYP